MKQNNTDSWAYELLREFKHQSKRWFTVCLVLIGVSVSLCMYTIYLLNDFGYVEVVETTSSDIDMSNESGDNNYNEVGGDYYYGENEN